MNEKEIENYLRTRVKELGGKAYKFVSPGNAGVPDRLVCLPGGRIAFVELKAPGKAKSLTGNQKRQVEYLKRLGQQVWIIDSKLGVDEFIAHCAIVGSGDGE